MKTMTSSFTFSAMILSAATVAGCAQLETGAGEPTEEPASGAAVAEAVQSIEAVAPVPNGLYRLRVQHSGMCIDTPPGCDDPSNPDTCLSAPLIQRPCNGGAINNNNTQAFELTLAGYTAAGAATYQIKQPRTGKCAYMAGPTKENGGIAVLHHCSVPITDTRQFVIGASGVGVWGNITPLYSGRCLNVVGSSPVACAAIYQWSSAPWGACPNPAQMFRLENN